MFNQKKKFQEYLKSKSLAFTKERKLILDKVFSISGHFEAEDLFFSLRKKKKRVSRATVYRTLDLLVKSGSVSKIDFGEAHSHYEHILEQEYHGHLVCLKCGKIIEFENEKIGKLKNEEAKRNNFQIMRHSLEFYGYCSRCRK